MKEQCPADPPPPPARPPDPPAPPEPPSGGTEESLGGACPVFRPSGWRIDISFVVKSPIWYQLGPEHGYRWVFDGYMTNPRSSYSWVGDSWGENLPGYSVEIGPFDEYDGSPECLYVKIPRLKRLGSYELTLGEVGTAKFGPIESYVFFDEWQYWNRAFFFKPNWAENLIQGDPSGPSHSIFISDLQHSMTQTGVGVPYIRIMSRPFYRGDPYPEEVAIPPACFDLGDHLPPEKDKNPWPWPWIDWPPPKPPKPPIKKRGKTMDNDCCLLTVRLLKRILRNQGDYDIKKNPWPVKFRKYKGVIGGDYEEVSINDFLELEQKLLQYSGDVDSVLGTKQYKRPSGKCMNPNYERPSEDSFFGGEPGTDKKGNDRELEYGKGDREVNCLAEEIRLLLKALDRLEYLFPSGEIKDARIARHLIMPGAKKSDSPLKVYNVIHFYELLVQYLDKTLGDPTEPIVIKDVDPTKKGDQEFSFKALNMAGLLREIFKFLLDVNGDIDMVREFSVRDFRTALANRQNIIQIMSMVDALVEDSGMLTIDKWEKVFMEGDPYAGLWNEEKKGFDPSPKLESHEEKDIEELARAMLQAKEIKMKVTLRSPKEKQDLRDLLRGLAQFIERLMSTSESLDKLFENARFKVQTDMALIRSQVTKAASAARSRTRKRKK